MRISHALITALALTTVTVAALPAQATWDGAEVTLTGCTEVVGLDVIPADNARALVPEEFDLVLADEAGELAVLIVRVVQCAGIAVNNHPPSPGKFMHIGINVANGDATAFINNYQLWFATNHRPLKRAMRRAGLQADFDNLTYDYTPNGDGTGAINIDVSPPNAPAFEATGTGFLLDIPRGPFIASWWAEGLLGLIQMRGDYQDVLFGVSDAVATTPASSDLAALAGRTTLGFAVLNTYNDVPAGQVTFSVADEDPRCHRPRGRRHCR